MKKWYNNYKYSYNRATWYMNESTTSMTRFEIRDIVVSQETNYDKPWLLETPFNIRTYAVFEACKNR